MHQVVINNIFFYYPYEKKIILSCIIINLTDI